MNYVWAIYSRNDKLKGYVNTYEDAVTLCKAKGWWCKKLDKLNHHYPNANP